MKRLILGICIASALVVMSPFPSMAFSREMTPSAGSNYQLSANVSGFISVRGSAGTVTASTQPGEEVHIRMDSANGYLSVRNIVLPEALTGNSSVEGNGTISDPFQLKSILTGVSGDEPVMQSKIRNTELNFVRNFYAGSSSAVDENPRRITLGNSTLDVVIVTSGLDESPVYYCFDVTDFVAERE